MTHVDLEFINQVTSAPKLNVFKVQLPEWGDGKFAYVGQMTADERDERIETVWLERKERLGIDGNVGFRAFAVAACMCDENRKWLAVATTDIDSLADKLGKSNVLPVQRMFMHACTLNGLTQEDVEELEKN